MRRGLLAGVAVLGVAVAVAGCGSGATKATTPGGAISVSASPGTAELRLTDSANNTTVHATVGQTVVIALGSSYWSEVTSSAPQLLQRVAQSHPMTSSSPSFCPPGGGCGAQPSSFVAKAAGSARLTADRHVCGEAMACSPDQRTFTVTVEITG
ncbi:hypothetical protein E6W39_25470 [Kitasatospora acidiphila]|uniref:Proteinase inhibitor I42 chagasin domain-containing protein n=1 Tax=Kitasatospora acidiphila TaxID=2567942 RepID=A0A540W7I5_9ACTN|nr:hypothetical protein [Kitasatospora acidiphila]TQF04968.1 hypothetical protein E6W39_25470 [Kitasatospora acidiphila]